MEGSMAIDFLTRAPKQGPRNRRVGSQFVLQGAAAVPTVCWQAEEPLVREAALLAMGGFRDEGRLV